MLKHYKLICLGLLVSVLFACAPKTVITPAEQKPSVTQQKPEDILRSRAENAWNTQNMMEAERLYSIIVNNQTLDSTQANIAWERLIKAAISNGHTHSAFDALERWRFADPSVDKTQVWVSSWQQILSTLSQEEIDRYSLQAFEDTSRATSIRFIASMNLLAMADKAFLDKLSLMYNDAEPTDKLIMERELLAKLSAMPDAWLNTALPLTITRIGAETSPVVPSSQTPDSSDTPKAETGASESSQKIEIQSEGLEANFPYSIIFLEQTRRSANVDKALFDAMLAKLHTLKFEDTSLAGVISAPSTSETDDEKSTIPNLPLPSLSELIAGPISFSPTCTVLAIPTGGLYSGIGGAITAGANFAKEQMAGLGIDINVYIIDTENPSWLSQVNSLPASCTVVGGPLRQAKYKELKDTGALNNKVFLSFLQKLDAGDEGRLAWRFFSSRDDQINTLLDFGASVGASSYGSLYSGDDYSQAMLNDFTQKASARGASVGTVSTFNIDDPSSLARLAGDFVGVHMVREIPVPVNSFQGIFFPDSWSNMDLLVSNIFYQGEDTQILMGTSIWEQTLLENPPRVVSNYELAVFPGVLNRRSLNAPTRLMFSGMSDSQNSTWFALGYDFVRFASALNINSMQSPEMVNAALAKAQSMNFAMAPIRWQNGIASQDLFILSPAKEAPALVDVNVFRKKYEAIKARAARRAENARRRKL